jgi:hypothetical protein
MARTDPPPIGSQPETLTLPNQPHTVFLVCGNTLEPHSRPKLAVRADLAEQSVWCRAQVLKQALRSGSEV